MNTIHEQLKAERIDLTAENINYYSEKLIELSASLNETLKGKHPQDALSLMIQIDDILDKMKCWTGNHVTKEREEKFWGAVAKVKANEM